MSTTVNIRRDYIYNLCRHNVMTDSLKGVLNNYIQVLLLYRLIHGISLYINDTDYMVGCYEMCGFSIGIL